MNLLDYVGMGNFSEEDPEDRKNKDKKDGINYNIISFAFLRAGRHGGHILAVDDGPCSSITLGLTALATQH